MSIGLVVGKFAPLHMGHVQMINRAATQVDHLYVVMSHDQKFVDKQPERLKRILTKNNRLRWLKQTFSDLEHITVLWVDETNIPEYPHGWKQFTHLLDSVLWDNGVDVPVDDITHVFGSELQDKDEYERAYPNCQYVPVDPDRSAVHISATQIRTDVFQHWSHLPSVVRADFAFKVCIVGPESTGKTTLVKYLAKDFGTSWVEEYGRTFVEQDLCGDESILEPKHYAHIAMKHKMMEEEELRTCNRILISDTNACTTAAFSDIYHGEVDPIVEAIAFQEQYDLIIMLHPDVEWVYDGLRHMGDPEERKYAYDVLRDWHYNSDKGFVAIGGTYQQRHEQALMLIETQLNQIYGRDQ